MIFFSPSVLGNRGAGMTEADRRMSSLSSMSGRISFLPESDRRLSAVSTASEDVALPTRKKPSTISGKRFSLSSGSLLTACYAVIILFALNFFRCIFVEENKL